VQAIEAGETVTPVPVVIVGAGTVEVQAIVGIRSVSLTLIVPPGTDEVQAITAGETVTPVPVVNFGAGTVAVGSTGNVRKKSVPVPCVMVGAGTVEVQAIVVALTVTPLAPGLTVKAMPTAPSLTTNDQLELPTVPEPVFVCVSQAPELEAPEVPDSKYRPAVISAEFDVAREGS